MRWRLPTNLSPAVVTAGAFVLAAFLSVATAIWAAAAIETRSARNLVAALSGAGYAWAKVATDGLQVTLTGTAPSEAARFRAIALAGTVVDPGRVIDSIEVEDPAAIKIPDFTIEMLRNDDGISLIGLVPAGPIHAEIVHQLSDIAGSDAVTDMLEAADQPVPEGWQTAVTFGVRALARLPRSKVSISPYRVLVTAIADSPEEKAEIVAELKRKAPKGIDLVLDISAPRPVITPYTLRFLIDEAGARFDACTADSDKSRERILAAARAAGAQGRLACTVGLGVPTPAWADAVTMGIAALGRLGAGSLTFTDADVALVAAAGVSQEDFDSAVGELESNLPEVFSLHAVLTPPADEVAEAAPAVPVVTAMRSPEGGVTISGRIGDELSREAVESFARSRFGVAAVHSAMRIAPDLPEGWSLRVLGALEALGELDSGTATVRPDRIAISGVSGSQTASDEVARILAEKLGNTAKLDLDVRYDEALDPEAGRPTAEQCVADINAILAESKINFEPGSAQITADGAATLDRIAERMRDCADYPIEVGGHTDSQGREEMNLALSQQRAQAIIVALMDRRVLTGNLTAVGYGETVPIADNATEAGREANRRIEFRLIRPERDAAAPAEAAAQDEEAPAIVVQTPDENTIRPRKRP